MPTREFRRGLCVPRKASDKSGIGDDPDDDVASISNLNSDDNRTFYHVPSQ
jgi:hypothetical protein